MMNIKKVAQIGVLISSLLTAGWAYSYDYYIISLGKPYPNRLAKFKGSDWWSKLVPEGALFTVGADQLLHLSSQYGSLVLSECDAQIATCPRDIATLSPNTPYVIDRDAGFPRISTDLPTAQFEFDVPAAVSCSTPYTIRFNNVADDKAVGIAYETPIKGKETIKFSYNRFELPAFVFYSTYRLYPTLYRTEADGKQTKVNSKLINFQDRREISKTDGLEPGLYTTAIQCPVAGHPAQIMVGK